MLNLQQFRSKAKGLPDVLNAAFLVGEPLVESGGQHPMGIVLNKSGSLMSGFDFSGPDIESSSETDLEMLSRHLNHAVARLGTGWSVHFDTIRAPADGYTDPSRCAFPDPVTALIDVERRQQYGMDGVHFVSRQVAVFSYDLPSDTEAKLAKLVVQNLDRSEMQLQEHVERFRSEMETIMAIFRGVAKLSPLNASELLTHVHGCITSDFHALNPPRVPAYLDAMLGAHDFLGGFEPKVDDIHIAVVNLAGFPPGTTPIVLESVNQLAMPFRFSLRFLFLDPAQANTELTKYRRNWFQKRHGLMSQVSQSLGGEGSSHENQDALRMARDADEAIAEASSGDVRYGYFTPTIVLHDADKSRLQERVKLVRKHFDNLGFVTRTETINAVEAFFGSIPGHCYENVRRPLLSSLSLMDLCPTTSIWTGDKDNPNPLYRPYYGGQPAPCLFYGATTGATPFRFSLHVGDLGHTLIAGPTGSGKSVLLAFMAAQHMRYPNARVFAFDKGWSMYALANAAGGAHYDIGNTDAPLAFAPLSRVSESASERAWAEDWIESLCTLQGVPVDAKRRNLIHEAVDALASPENDASGRSVDAFLNLVQDEDIKNAVSFYASTGRAGAILAAEQDALDVTGSRFSVFELEHLLTGGENSKLTVVPTLLYLFHRLEAAFDGAPTLLVLDEAWVMLDNPYFSGKIREWLKVLRKFNVAVVFATQSLADLQNSSLRPVLVESCPTKILLPNREAASQQLSPLYADLGLNDHQIRLLQQSTPKADYYVISADGRRRITLSLGPVALAFTAVSSRDDVKAVREMQHAYGRRWPVEWLRRRLATNQQDWVTFAGKLFDEAQEVA